MEILNNQPNLMCCVHHWLPNSELATPKYAPYMYKCPALPKLNGDQHVIFERNQVSLALREPLLRSNVIASRCDPAEPANKHGS